MNGEVSLNQDFRRKLRVIPGEYFVGFYKTRHILLPDSANCTVLRAVVLTQYRRVTDGQTDRRTDGIAVASTALAMRALRRAVKRSLCTHAQASQVLNSIKILSRTHSAVNFLHRRI